MRVALFVHCFYPEHFFGTESYTRTVARELLALGHEPVVVAARFPGEPAQSQLVERYEFDGIPVIRLDRNVHPNRTVRDTFDMPDIRFVHERILRELRPDVVHVCHLINHTAALLDVTAALGLPTVATFTDFFGFCYNNKLEAADGGLCAGPNVSRSNCVECALAGEPTRAGPFGVLRSPAPRRLMASALVRRPALLPGWRATVEALRERPHVLARAYAGYAGAIAPSRFLRDAYRRNGFEGALELSHFGIDIDRAAKQPSPLAKLRLGFVGQIARHKGLHLLLQALRMLPASSCSLQVWGDETQDSGYAAELRSLAQGLPVSFRGTFPPAELASVLTGMDLLVIPSTWFENSPLILLQALATHTPAIVADVEGMTEFVENGRSGRHFRRGDASDLAVKLVPFVQQPALAASMSASTAYVRTSRAMVEDVVALYDSVLSDRRIAGDRAGR